MAAQPPPGTPSTPPELLVEIHRIERRSAVVLKLAGYGLYAWFGTCAVRIAQALAGQVTLADVTIVVGVFRQLDKPAAPWLLALMFFGYGWAQARERRRKTEYLQARIAALEKMLLGRRSSSGLLPDGSTPRETQ